MSDEDTTRGPRANQDPTPPSGVPGEPSDATSAESSTGTSIESTADDTRRPGRVRYQDPSTSAPREPTVAEQRARREAQRRERAQREAAEAAATHKSKVRKRLLVGGGVAVGVVALVAVIYAASGEDETTAQCVDQNTNVVVDDSVCATGQESGGYTNSSGVFVPIFLGGFGGGQYRYNYGSSSPVGSAVSGGSAAAPAGGTALRGTSGSSVGTSGSNGTVSRGGLGVGGSSSGTASGSGSSAGSSSGGSSSSGS